MGEGFILHCDDCHWAEEYYVGEGRLSGRNNYIQNMSGSGEINEVDFPSFEKHDDIYPRIMNGEFGDFVKKLFLYNPNIVFRYSEKEILRILYCFECKTIHESPRDIKIEYWDNDCNMVIRFDERCPICNGLMEELPVEEIEYADLVCPECHGDNVHTAGAMILWD